LLLNKEQHLHVETHKKRNNGVITVTSPITPETLAGKSMGNQQTGKEKAKENLKQRM